MQFVESKPPLEELEPEVDDEVQPLEVEEELLELELWPKAWPASISTAISELILKNDFIGFSPP